MSSQQKEFDLVWGAKEIGEELNLTTRQVFHAYENSQIPIGKVMGKYVASTSKLHAYFDRLFNESSKAVH